jgi:hypothetical protein
MGYRIKVEMTLVPGAAQRLFTLLAQRHVEVESASFYTDRERGRIAATIEVALDAPAAQRLARQLTRHHDIQKISLDSESDERPSERAPARALARRVRRITMDTRKGACL